MISINGHTLSLKNTWAVAVRQEPCALAAKSRHAVSKSRVFVEKVAASPQAVYGINTGFGPLSGTRVQPQDLKQHQVNLLHHLSVGQGNLFSKRETRAIMLARANALARGFSGIRPEVVDLLIAMINQNILPEIPEEGSVGASGDLVPLAHMARTLMGAGHVRIASKRYGSMAALKKFKLQPVTFQCKEALAMVNGTSVMTGVAALSVYEANIVLRWGELLTSALVQLLGGAPEVFCSLIQKARGHRGQYVVAERIAADLKRNPAYARQIRQHSWGADPKPLEQGVEIQDPYSLRCTPQIYGAFQDALWHIEGIVTQELNASTDNPLVFADEELILHGGNFYGQHVSMTCDYLRIGLSKVALLLDRQLDRLVNWRYSNGLPALLTPSAPGLHSGMAGCQLLATSLTAEARILSTPASNQTIPTNANNQDVVSMGCISARMTSRQLPLLWKLLAIQSLALVQAADLKKSKGAFSMSTGFEKLHQMVRSISPMLKEDRPLEIDIQQVVQLLQDERNQRECLGKLK